MNEADFKLQVSIEGDYITALWTKTWDAVTGGARFSRYPEIQIRFKFSDIAEDTVSAMLRDLEVPAPASKAIMTVVSARAT